MSNSQKVTALGHGVFRVERADGTQITAYGVADGAKAWVFLDGLTFVVDHDASRRSRTGQDAAALAAPMPATVTQVHVTPGQQVRAGDVLVTLEAMKMELPIRATADGVIKAVNCRVGEMVQPNIPLLEVDERQPEHGPGAGNIEG